MLPSPPLLLDSLACILRGLSRAIAARAAKHPAGPQLCLLYAYLQRSLARFARLAAQLEAGTLPRPATPRPPRPSRRPEPKPHWPRSFLWLMRSVPEARACAAQLQALLANPEMQAIATHPRAARQLRPLCRLLGVATQPAPPGPPRAPRKRPQPAVPPSPPAQTFPPERTEAGPRWPHRPSIVLPRSLRALRLRPA